MNICIAATSLQQEQLQKKGVAESATVTWVAHTEAMLRIHADAYIDCTFCANQFPETKENCLYHSPVDTLTNMQAKARQGRFCAWNTFLERPIWEIAITDIEDFAWINKLMTSLGWNYCLVKDEPGLVAPRLIAGIINEANYALEAGVSSKDEIDLAMKLGTNYPYGPFEWADKIGKNNIDALLKKLKG